METKGRAEWKKEDSTAWNATAHKTCALDLEMGRAVRTAVIHR